ncbi:MAG: efflux RND transporter periplasmic adaptor subunit [Nitrospirales bacterium]|nr:efflux RND transporter periplasmic adaptor subunit [Nitrospirales bacterium]
MRNKVVVLLMVLLFGMSVALTGCGREEAPKEEKTAAGAKKGETEEAGGKEEKGEGEPGVVALSLEKQKASGVEVMKVAAEAVAVPLTATAMIELNADRVSKVSPRVMGKTTKIMVSQGNRVKAGQPLTYIDSVELDQAWSEYVKAKGRRELALKNLQREEALFEKKVSPEKDLLKARQELSEAEADLALSQNRFRLLGIDASQMERAKNGGRSAHHPLIPLSSPITGVVIEKTVTQGEVVGPDKTLFTVADLSTLWVLIDIYEKDIARLRSGMAVKVSVSAFPEREFKGTLSYIGDVVDEKTRTVKARVTVNNAGGLLKPGMFATVLVDAATARKEQVIAVPSGAVLIEGAARYVFVQTEPAAFKRKDVVVGRSLVNKVEITEGLKEGDAVVVKGAFTLKSESKKEELAEE